MNLWVENYLHQFVSGWQNDWSMLLPMAEFTHNLWRHEHTKHTSHKLITGVNLTASINTPEDAVLAAQDRLKELQESRSDAQKALQKCIKPINPPRTFDIGDKVWLDARNLHVQAPSKKLSPWRYGPFKVTQQVSQVPYRIKHPPSMKIHNIFHVNLLISYKKTEAYRETFPQPPPELIDGQKEYKVKEIITDHYNKRKWKRQYLVKWVGRIPYLRE